MSDRGRPAHVTHDDVAEIQTVLDQTARALESTQFAASRVECAPRRLVAPLEAGLRRRFRSSGASDPEGLLQRRKDRTLACDRGLGFAQLVDAVEGRDRRQEFGRLIGEIGERRRAS